MNPSRVHLPRAIRHRIHPLAVGCAAILSSRRAAADCRIDVVGSGGPAWTQAVGELNAELARHAWASRCSSVLVDASGSGATLTFTTRDGQSVQRRIDAPIELVPTIESLSVDDPTSVTPDGAPPTPVAPADQGRHTEAAPKASDPYAINPVYGAQLCVRAGADHLVSPCIGAFGAVPIGNWELGILGRYEGHYVSTLGGNKGAPETSGLAFGVSAGHRTPLGPFAVRIGLTGLLAAVREDARRDDRGRAEGRLGGFLGGVWPARSSIRLRADLAFEVVPYSIGRSETNITGASSLPWWGLTTAVGVELQ